ncbi:MAG: bifunctional DNA-formamidopyrimidine glycosylase/DNA-(apurinic or apyrimidinic site) lyase [Vulcanimicrobiaceae bacterium]
MLAAGETIATGARSEAGDVPELPEVETIARGLANAISGRTIDDATVALRKVVAPEPERFVRALRGETVEGVGRRGKFVVVRLGSGQQLAVHLRMTGRLIVQPAGTREPEPYTTVLLTFRDGLRLCFADVRQFGRMRLFGPEEPWAADIGVEPLSGDFSFERFSSLLDGRTTPIKVFLLDQRRIAGIGNIYACEALWEARIRPTTPAGTLSRQARQRLHQSIGSVLRHAVEMRGTSVDDYVDAEGLRGGFQNELKVYGRDGLGCARCARPIVRTVLAQRGTWWCRACQRR